MHAELFVMRLFGLPSFSLSFWSQVAQAQTLTVAEDELVLHLQNAGITGGYDIPLHTPTPCAVLGL